jgi:hypothetical protein
MELLAWAEQAGCWLIEDDYDGEFRYDARPLAALRRSTAPTAFYTLAHFPKCCFRPCASATWCCRRACAMRSLPANG